MTARTPAARYAPAAALVLLYALSRAGFYLAGVRFDLVPLATSWQILDPVLLRQDLLTSVLFMPGQPPLYNLMLGSVLKLAQSDIALRVIFRVLYSAFALAAVLFLYAVLRRVGVARAPSLAVTAAFMLSPALVLYEAIPYYTLPVLALLGAMAWLASTGLDHGRWPRLLALFWVMAALVYTRSMFQVQWFVVLAGFMALALPGRRRRVLLAAALPLVLILALYAKNYAVVGSFATSDWLGMSLSKLTTRQLTPDQRSRMIAAGTASPMARLDAPFKPFAAYRPYIDAGPPTGIAVLDQQRKSTGHINFNFRGYARVSRQARADALAVIRTRPAIYLHAVGTAWAMFFRPSSDYPFLQTNREAISPWARGYARAVGQIHYPTDPGFDLRVASIGWLIVPGYALAVAFGLFVALRCIVRRRMSRREATLIFIWLNVLYVSVIGNLLEVDENQRFRFAINPFLLILLAAFGQAISQAIGAHARAWLSRSSPPSRAAGDGRRQSRDPGPDNRPATY